MTPYEQKTLIILHLNIFTLLRIRSIANTYFYILFYFLSMKFNVFFICAENPNGPFTYRHEHLIKHTATDIQIIEKKKEFVISTYLLQVLCILHKKHMVVPCDCTLQFFFISLLETNLNVYIAEHAEFVKVNHT